DWLPIVPIRQVAFLCHRAMYTVQHQDQGSRSAEIALPEAAGVGPQEVIAVYVPILNNPGPCLISSRYVGYMISRTTILCRRSTDESLKGKSSAAAILLPSMPELSNSCQTSSRFIPLLRTLGMGDIPEA